MKQAELGGAVAESGVDPLAGISQHAAGGTPAFSASRI